MHSMRAETQENYIIPDANISRITWSAPKLNYDLPERIKKKFLRRKSFMNFRNLRILETLIELGNSRQITI